MNKMKQEELIRKLAINAPQKANARYYYFYGAKVMLSAFDKDVDSEEFERIIEGAKSLADDILEVADDFYD